MPIYKQDGTLITNIVQTAISRPDVVKIKNRTLDGKWNIQTIGTGATLLDVGAYFTYEEKTLFDNANRNGALIKVVFDGVSYTGVIDGEVNMFRIPSDKDPMFGANFVLLVLSEGVV